MGNLYRIEIYLIYSSRKLGNLRAWYHHLARAILPHGNGDERHDMARQEDKGTSVSIPACGATLGISQLIKAL